ncbi:KxYKxGKxW signal peptide domain-containing protein [Liquorilactobacillus satsumensis]|uniref:KxYKxGKxW signal peptide domain-containing protein n=1 Tax=Liquorilactobacillus satsumensis TaxID=259059 RepID=UPI0021C3A5ED|nr:KxYKxGKxW signal peptide domain-containing protein [Liquorilactobacillus satsumensis]MCP9313141.1 KxYKxGKxW signal peptide domain-containing protein [Liquorilactobacillus satsumensis]MCP9359325.1 KxYKxGKxW signal peptide domain-containing protein [Liquorilactobacillus satsumensis]
MHKHNEEKLHYKMYKAGKFWLYSTIAVSSFVVGVQLKPVSTALASEAKIESDTSSQKASSSSAADSSSSASSSSTKESSACSYTEIWYQNH